MNTKKAIGVLHTMIRNCMLSWLSAPLFSLGSTCCLNLGVTMVFFFVPFQYIVLKNLQLLGSHLITYRIINACGNQYKHIYCAYDSLWNISFSLFKSLLYLDSIHMTHAQVPRFCYKSFVCRNNVVALVNTVFET